MNEFLAHYMGLGKSKSQNHVKELFLSIYVMYIGQPSVKNPLRQAPSSKEEDYQQMMKK